MCQVRRVRILGPLGAEEGPGVEEGQHAAADGAEEGPGVEEGQPAAADVADAQGACEEAVFPAPPDAPEEEARRPRRVRDPSAPTRAQWDEHQSMHLPFRSWCPECVAGRMDNPPHRAVPADEHQVPEVHLDYAFARRREEDEVVPILVMKHRQSRAIRCWVVPRKGALEIVAAEVAQRGIRDFGITGPVIIKSDGEGPILALRRRVQALHPGEALEQGPAAYEHESNGVIENGNKLGKGLLRVHLLSLERKLGGHITCTHPVFAWLTEFVGDAITKYLVGKDGKTPYERLYGKGVNEEGLEFGESLWWRPPRGGDYNVLLEPRWREGVWLGRKWGSPVHFVWDAQDSKVHAVRAVQRRPRNERWQRAAVEAVTALPGVLQSRAGGDDEEVEIIAPADGLIEPPPQPSDRHPNRAFISDADLQAYGYTQGCPRCTKMRAGLPARGVKHREACRRRIEARLREAGDPRIIAADERTNQRLVDLAPPAGEEGGTVPGEVREEQGAEAGEGRDDSIGAEPGNDGCARRAGERDEELRPAEAAASHGENEEHCPSEMDEGEPGEGDMAVDALGTLRRGMPPGLQEEVEELLDLFAVRGYSRADARLRVSELYSPPRVTSELQRMRQFCPGMVLWPGSTFDLASDENGQSYDLLLARDRQRVRERIQTEKPWLVIGSPPCRDYSTLNEGLNFRKMPEEEVRRRLAARAVHLHFALEIYRLQLKGGRHFLHEHPAGASSWHDEQVRRLLNDRRVSTVVGHQCRYGQSAVSGIGDRLPVLKPTRFMSSAPELLSRLSLRCSRDHEHQPLTGGRAAAAARYPPQLCRAIILGAEAQARREGRPLPSTVAARLDAGLAVLALGGELAEALEVEEGLLDSGVQHESEALETYGRQVVRAFDEYTGDELPPQLVREARAEEVAMMEEWAVWDVVEVAEAHRVTGKPPLKGRWVDTNKGDRARPDVRSRWCAKELALHRSDQFFAATPPLEALRLILSIACTGRQDGSRGGRKVLLLDAKKAHLHAMAVRNVYVDLPPERAQRGRCCRLRRCLYGTRDAPQQWERFAAATLEAIGFKRGLASAVCFHHSSRDLVALVHGDDFFLCGEDKDLDWVHRELEKTILLKVVGRLGGEPEKGDVQELRCLNRVLRWQHNGVLLEADPRHAEILAAMLGPGASPLSTPGVKDHGNARGRVYATTTGIDEDLGARLVQKEAQLKLLDVGAGRGGEARVVLGGVGDRSGELGGLATSAPGEAPLGASQVGMFRAGAARANYLALDRPEIAYAAKELCRRMAEPRNCDLAALRRIARYLLGVPRRVYHFQWQPDACLDAYVDTDFAGCPTTRRSTSGGCVLRGGHLIKHWSSTQKVVTLSSGEAELAGVVKGAGEALGIQSVARDLGLEVAVRLHADSSAAIGICSRSGIGRIRHLAVGQLWVQEKIRDKTISLHKCAGEHNPGDLFTKHLDRAKIEHHLSLICVRSEPGRAVSAPKLATEVQAFLAPVFVASPRI